ncbi:IS3 family transposase, partial [Sporosarcina cyprini]|uniref:IS3 family transposase n=1 Tax=Sporosarcina cyprini TaxID=2910523 RepID=UPI001EDCDA81
EMNLVQSMSRRGNCWDNACIESFFGKLKTEMPGFSTPETQDEMIQAVTDYIAYYNGIRPQLKFKMSPIAYRLAQAA